MNQTPDKKVALMIAMLAAFFVPFMGSSVNIVLPSIGKDFAMAPIASAEILPANQVSTKL